MKHPKPKQSKKMLRNLKNMRFVKREMHGEDIWDYFFQEVAQITLIRQMVRSMNCTNPWHYVRWTCPELGRGTAGISYWLAAAAKRHRPVK